MEKTYSEHYYFQHYPLIQQSKYAQLWPHIQSLLPTHARLTMLDVGIGPAWLEDFLFKQNVSFSRIVGVDISQNAIAPPKKEIEYVISPSFSTHEKFDLVVCFDAWHCFPEMDLQSFVKPNGLLLVSEPRPFVHLLDKLSPRALLDVWVGETEKSRVVVIQT